MALIYSSNEEQFLRVPLFRDIRGSGSFPPTRTSFSNLMNLSNLSPESLLRNTPLVLPRGSFFLTRPLRSGFAALLLKVPPLKALCSFAGREEFPQRTICLFGFFPRRDLSYVARWIGESFPLVVVFFDPPDL